MAEAGEEEGVVAMEEGWGGGTVLMGVGVWGGCALWLLCCCGEAGCGASFQRYSSVPRSSRPALLRKATASSRKADSARE